MIIDLTVKNSRIHLVNPSDDVMTIIRMTLSFTNPKSRMIKSEFPPEPIRFYRTKSDQATGAMVEVSIPYGLKKRFTAALTKAGYTYKIDDPAPVPISFRNIVEMATEGEWKLDDIQQQTVIRLLRTHVGSAELSVGSGKTIVMAELAGSLFLARGEPVAIVVPKKQLLHQVYEELRKFLPSFAIGLIGDSKRIPGDIRVCTAATLSSEKLDRDTATWFGGIGALLMDECVPYDTLVLTDVGEAQIGDIVTKDIAGSVVSQGVDGIHEMKPIISRTPMGVKEIWEVEIEVNGVRSYLQSTGNGKVRTDEGYTRVDQLMRGHEVRCANEASYRHERCSPVCKRVWKSSCELLSRKVWKILRGCLHRRSEGGEDEGAIGSADRGSFDLPLWVRSEARNEKQGGSSEPLHGWSQGVDGKRYYPHSEAGAVDPRHTPRRRECIAGPESHYQSIGCSEAEDQALHQEAASVLSMEEGGTSCDNQRGYPNSGHPGRFRKAISILLDTISSIHPRSVYRALHPHQDRNPRVSGQAKQFRPCSVVDGRRLDIRPRDPLFSFTGAGSNHSMALGEVERGSGPRLGQKARPTIPQVPSSETDSPDSPPPCHPKPNVQVRAVRGVVVSTRRTGRFVETFDIGVADNHNFYADGILVHNCHHIVSPTWRSLLTQSRKTARVWGVSGKLTFTDQFDTVRIEALLGPPVISARNEERLCPVEVIIHASVSKQWTKVNYPAKLETGVIVHHLPAGSKDWLKCTYIQNGLEGTGTYHRARLINTKKGDTLYETAEDMGMVLSKPRNQWAIKLAETIVNEEGGKVVLTFSRGTHGMMLSRTLTKRGVTHALVNGKMTGPKQQAVFASLETGEVKVVVAHHNCMKEGTNVRSLTDIIILNSPVSHQSLEQLKGRVEREIEGKAKGRVHLPGDFHSAPLRGKVRRIMAYYRTIPVKLVTV